MPAESLSHNNNKPRHVSTATLLKMRNLMWLAKKAEIAQRRITKDHLADFCDAEVKEPQQQQSQQQQPLWMRRRMQQTLKRERSGEEEEIQKDQVKQQQQRQQITKITKTTILPNFSQEISETIWFDN